MDILWLTVCLSVNPVMVDNLFDSLFNCMMKGLSSD